MSTGSQPPEATKVTCVAKGEHTVLFEGQEIAPDDSRVTLLLVGKTEYFEVGKSFAVVFSPLG